MALAVTIICYMSIGNCKSTCPNTVRQTWNITELEDSANQKAFQATFRSNFAASHANCPYVLENDPKLRTPGHRYNGQTTSRIGHLLPHICGKHPKEPSLYTISVKTVGPNNRPYWDLELRELVKLRGAAYAEARNSEVHSPNEFPAYWAKYISLRQQVHALASRKKDERYQHLLTKIDTLFINDRRHFFHEIVKLRKDTSDATQMHALRAPTIAEAPVTVTSNPNDIKQILYEFHSGLGHHNRLDRRFDTNHMTSVENEVNAVPLSEVGPEFCEMDIINDEVLESLTKVETTKPKA
jgi:hypothetical protein